MQTQLFENLEKLVDQIVIIVKHINVNLAKTL
jgi:hypothetical protein